MGNTINSGKLRASISIVPVVRIPRVSLPDVPYPPESILPRNQIIPAEVPHVFSNTTEKKSTIEIHLFFGENEFKWDNVYLGRFIHKGIPPAPEGPSQITIKVSVSVAQEIWILILDPAANEYRSIGYVDLSKIEAPIIIPPESQENTWENFSFTAELFTELFTDLFLNNSNSPMPIAGKDICHALIISFEEALHGVQKNIEVLHTETCPACSGSGTKPGTTPEVCTYCKGTGSQRTQKQTDLGEMFQIKTCETCKGTGETIPNPCSRCQGRTWVKDRHPFTLNIPPGIDSGTQICFPHLGESGQYGGRAGNLYITVNVAKHSLFCRIGHNISIHLPLSASLARKGGQVNVPSVETGSYFLLNIPVNTQQGAVVRIYGNNQYTLNGIIDIRHPLNLFALVKNHKRLRAIRKALNSRDFEIRMHG